ncbi:hypothetical protein GH733_005802 [Mirounga leonina]|nr:hypothetical protein GH733_005802 [Mirounga leonina]
MQGQGVDTAISSKKKSSVGPTWWLLVREFLRMRSTISHERLGEVVRDLSFYGDSEKVDKEEQSPAEKTPTREEFWGDS